VVRFVFLEDSGPHFKAVGKIVKSGSLLSDLDLLLPELGFDIFGGDGTMKILARGLNVHLQIRNNTCALLDVGFHVLQVKKVLA
jgi:hypothetical protein